MAKFYNMDLLEKKISTQKIYDGKILSLRKDEVELPNGTTSFREIVSHSGGSAILCVDDGKVLLVKQFRYVYDTCIWEIPAGKLNPNEDPKETARRELEEECGIVANKLDLISTVYPSPGYTDEIIKIYRAYDLMQGKTNFDEDENLISKWFDIGEALNMIKNGEIKDAKTIIALLTLK